jgi:mono/diheme cytochrome c family protein
MRSLVDHWVALLAIAGLAVSSGSMAALSVDIAKGNYEQQSGEELYRGICQGCHMPDAKGAIGAGAYPALANNARLIARQYPISVVINGQRAMPSFGTDLSDEQIANVINYVRTHFGNHYKDAVTAETVKAARH